MFFHPFFHKIAKHATIFPSPNPDSFINCRATRIGGKDTYCAVLYASLLDPRVMRCGGMEFTAKPSGILVCLIKYHCFNCLSSKIRLFSLFFSTKKQFCCNISFFSRICLTTFTDTVILCMKEFFRPQRGRESFFPYYKCFQQTGGPICLSPPFHLPASENLSPF